TAPAGRAALHCDVLHGFRRAECLVQMVDVADLGSSGISFSDSCWISDARPELFPYVLWILHQTYGIAEGFRHLRPAIQTHDPTCGRQQWLWLGEKALSTRCRLTLWCHITGRELRIPPARDDARQLKVLNLVLTDRNHVSFI